MAWVKERIKFKGKNKKGKTAHQNKKSLWHQLQMMRRGTMRNEQQNVHKPAHSLL